MTMISSSLPDMGAQERGYERAQTDAAAKTDAAARSDIAIEEEIWNRIHKDPSLGERYQRNIAVEVEHGSVRLRGHVLKAWHAKWIENIAGRVRGALFVHNHLVPDEVLQNQVIQALLRDESTAPFIFTVRSTFGWVSIGGFVPSQAAAIAAEGVAGSVADVRGVLSLPAVVSAGWTQEETEPIRRALQPSLAAAVYEDGDQVPGAVGLVSQIIIDPCSRLVSAIAVRRSGSPEAGGAPVEYLVPMSAVEAVNERGVWLKEGQTLGQFERFEKSAFPLPPPGWQPPFPYLPGMVRWSL